MCLGIVSEEGTCTDSLVSGFPAQPAECSSVNKGGRASAQTPDLLLTQERKRDSCPPVLLLPSEWMLLRCHPEEMHMHLYMPRVCRAHRAQTLCPSALQSPLAGRDAQECGAPILHPWKERDLSQAPVGGSVPQGGSGLWNRGGSLAPSGTMTEHDGGCCSACVSWPRTPASATSAPGVPGGPAAAEAVAPLPGAVDEAQGVLELLVGGFLDGLVGEVHLGGTEGVREGCRGDPGGPPHQGPRAGLAFPRFYYQLWPQMLWWGGGGVLPFFVFFKILFM